MCMPKMRLDLLLVERGLAESRAKAQAMIMAGQVRVAEQVALKPATAISTESELTVDSGPRFVSRGGEKLDAALQAHRTTPRFAQVLGVSSLLLGDRPVGGVDPASIEVTEGDVIEVLPPFAGG